jgi:Holliday junction resolvase RusA-like endonuclease
MTAILTIRESLPGMNDIIDQARTNKYKSAEYKKVYTELVAWTARAQKIPKMDRIDLIITWFEGNRKRDPDNIHAGVKFILDGLVQAGVIPNDNQRHVGDITHRVRTDRERTRIEVELIETEAGE